MLHQFVRTGSKSPPLPGSMGIPLPPPGMFGGGGGGMGGEEESTEPIEPESERLVRRPSTGSNQSGCFCNSNGCSGTDCSTMNGCVCSQGACWGAACDSRIPVTQNTGSPMVTSGNLISTSTSTLPLGNPLQLVRNALFASSPIVSVNGQPTNQQGQQQQQQMQLSANAVTIGDCSCNNLGCSGSGCANMNGCFCVGSNCWGNACNVNSMVQTSGNLLATSLGQTNQMQLPNLAGRLTLPNGQLTGQLTLPTAQLTLNNGQTGQTANLLDIPGLTGPGGILSSLLPGGFGGGNPFGGGGNGGAGGGGDFGGQGMQVVKGVPVKRLTASRARRIRGQATRGRPGMELAATRGRVRPSHTVRKRIRPIQESDETSRSLTILPNDSIDPVLSVIQLNELTTSEKGKVTNSTLTAMDERINFNDNALVESSIEQEPEESVDVFTLTDQWL